MAKGTKQSILIESLRLFREHGYSNVSVEDICSSLGITRGTFYYHFKTKAAVLESIYVDHRNRDWVNLNAMFSEDRWEQLWWLIGWAIEATEEFGSDLYGSLVATSLTENIDTFRTSQQTRDALMNVIAAGQRSGQFRNPVDPGILAEAVVSIVLGVGLEWSYQKGAFPLVERNRKEIMALLAVQTL